MEFKNIFNVSNFLSFIRLLLIIPAWFAFDNFDVPFYRYSIAAIGIFASVTDILDGYLARKLNQITEFGKLIDPLADKVLIAFVVINLFILNEIPEYYFYLIIGRDLLILIGGLIVTKKIGKVLPSDYLGKITVLSISFVLLVILFKVSTESLLYQLLFYLSIFLIITSFVNYLFRAYRILTQSKK